MPERLRLWLGPLLRAYSAILFCNSAWVGVWFAAMTCWTPRAALMGLVALVCSALLAEALSLSRPGDPHLVNSLLTGLVLGGFHVLDWTLVAWVVIASLFVTLASHWLAELLWRAGRLPVMSLPFVLAVWLVALAGQMHQAAAILPAALSSDPGTVFCQWADDFFVALGWLLLVPYPLAGALLFAGLAVASRYLALLALAGYIAGQLVMGLLGRGESNAIGFNFMLAAMALGGVFAIPGRASFLVAIAGGAMAAWFAGAQAVLLQPYHLPVLTLPFLCAVYLWLGGLATRVKLGTPYLTLENPSAPEAAYERMRLAEVRGGDARSVPLHPPFFGEWRVSQGFDGPHTHRFPWQHALDFDIVEGARPHSGDGMKQGDYFCFGSPVLAPVAAQVVKTRDEMPDVAPGRADVGEGNNWGNFLLLRTAAGDHVLLAHLKLGSITVRAGEWVAAGQRVAACGSSGRSPEPHLHLHVQGGETLGSPTRPFHLSNIIVRSREGVREFRLFHRPAEGELLAAAPRDVRISSALPLSPGRVLNYRLRGRDGEAPVVGQLRSEMTLLGQSRIATSSGASAAFEESPAVLGYYDRQGPREPLLDLWLLALGLTPLSALAESWVDRPPVRLLPIGPAGRLCIALLRPLGAGCESRYRRTWDDTTHSWRQDGEHVFRLLPWLPGECLQWRARTRAWIEPGRGVRRLQLAMPGRRFDAILETDHTSAVA